MIRFSIRDIFDRCNELKRRGFRVIDAHIGAPSHKPPIPVKEALRRVNSDIGDTYKPFVGLPQLRYALAEYIEKYLGVDADPEKVIVTGSGAHALFITFLMFSGGRGLVPELGFPHYFNQARLCGVELDYYNPVSEDIVGEVMGKLRETTKFVLVNYPHNPTGYYPRPKDLETLYEKLRDRNILVVNDAVYHEIYYEERPPMIGDIYIDSVSKSFALPGIRVGYVYWEPENHVQAGKMVYYTTAGTSDIAQAIVVEMLKETSPDYFRKVRSYYKPRRDMAKKLLSELGFEFPEPRGAFYVFVSHKKIGDATELALKLLGGDRDVYVGLVPGLSFGGSAQTLRISYGYLSLEDIQLMAEELRKELAE